MNKGVLSMGVLGIMLLGTEVLYAKEPVGSDEGCSVMTLKGNYRYSIQGYRDGKPYASGGFMSFDGQGQVVNLYTNSVNREQRLATGTYHVDPDCSGAMTLDGTTVNRFYLSPTGDGFSFVRVSGDGIIGTEATRVSRNLLIRE